MRELEDALMESEGDLSALARSRWKTRINRAVKAKEGEDKGWLCEATGTRFRAGNSKSNPGVFILDQAAE